MVGVVLDGPSERENLPRKTSILASGELQSLASEVGTELDRSKRKVMFEIGTELRIL